MFFFKESNNSCEKKDEVKITSLDQYMKLNTDELSNEQEDKLIEDFLNSKEFTKSVLLNEEITDKDLYKDMEDDYKDAGEDAEKGSEDLTTREKVNKIKKAKAKAIQKYIYKTLNFKKSEIAEETAPRKVLRLALTAAIAIGPYFLPYGPIIKLIGFVASFYLADKFSINSRKKTMELYTIKLQQVEKKIEEEEANGDEKAVYELKKIRTKLQAERFKLKRSLRGTAAAATDDSEDPNKVYSRY